MKTLLIDDQIKTVLIDDPELVDQPKNNNTLYVLLLGLLIILAGYIFNNLNNE